MLWTLFSLWIYFLNKNLIYVSGSILPEKGTPLICWLLFFNNLAWYYFITLWNEKIRNAYKLMIRRSNLTAKLISYTLIFLIFLFLIIIYLPIQLSYFIIHCFLRDNYFWLLLFVCFSFSLLNNIFISSQTVNL